MEYTPTIQCTEGSLFRINNIKAVGAALVWGSYIIKETRETASTLFWLMDNVWETMSKTNSLDNAYELLNPVYADSDWEMPKRHTFSKDECQRLSDRFARYLKDSDTNLSHAHSAYCLYLQAIMSGDEGVVEMMNGVANAAFVIQLRGDE